MSKITIYSPPATAQIKACAVDFDLRRAPVPVHLVQYDKTIPILAVSLYKGSSPYTLLADAEVNVRMNKRNNLCVYNPALGCNESRDVVYVAVTPQMTTQDGTFEPILEVVINSGVAGTSPMQLVIRRNPVQEDAIEDTSEAKTLTELVSQAAASATAAAQSAGAAAEDAGKAAASATAAAESKEAADATAQNIKDALDQIASNAAAVSQLKEATSALKDGKISKFYASSQGNTNLPDSDDGRIMDLMLYGKSEQKQYSGKNLFPPVAYSGNVSNLQIDAADGAVHLKGTPNDQVNSAIIGAWSASSPTIFTLPAGTYTLSGFGEWLATPRLNLVYVENGELISLSGNKTVTFDKETNFIAVFVYANANAALDITFKPMIEKGSTATDYEPYVGGIPSPNPEYPQEIKSVVKPSVKVCGKNLVGELMPGVIVWNTGDYISSEARYACTDFIPVKPGEKYTIFNATTTAERWYYDSNKKPVIGMPTGNITVTIPENIDYMRVTCLTENKDKFQIELGSTATAYEPYTEQTVTLPYTLNAIPVSSGGNITIDGQQYIADYVDVERGKLVRMCKELTFTGSEAWNMDSTGIWTSDNGNSFYTTLGYTVANTGLLSRVAHFIARGLESKFTDNSITVAGGNNQIEFIRTSYKTVSDFKAYLKANPVKVLVAPDTPDETDLTADEIAAFKALVSYYPVTNVSTTSDQLDGYTVFNYPISLAKGYDYLKTQLGDTRDYLYGIDLMTAEAYVNSEYAAALAEIEV